MSMYTHMCKFAYLLCICMFSMHSYMLTVSVHTCVSMSHSSCRYFISLLWLGEASWLSKHCDSYNLTNWDGWIWFESELMSVHQASFVRK